MGIRRRSEPSPNVCRAAIGSRASTFAAPASAHTPGASLFPAHAERGTARAVSDSLRWLRIGARAITVRTSAFDDASGGIWRGVCEGFTTGRAGNSIATSELRTAAIAFPVSSCSVAACERRVAASTRGVATSGSSVATSTSSVTTAELRVAACAHAVANAAAGFTASDGYCIAATGVLHIATAARHVVATAHGVRVAAPC